MAKYRKILVAVDGSDSSKNAFRQACGIGREDKSWITAITVIPSYEDQFQTLTIKEKVSRALKKEGQKVLQEIVKIADAEDIVVKTVLAEGDTADQIADAAEDGGYELIVMGRHGRGRLERAFMGSVTARVIGKSMADILVVPSDAALSWHDMLFPVDGSKNSISASERALDFAKSRGSSLTAVSVVDVTEEFYAQAPEAVERLIEKARSLLEDLSKKAGDMGMDIKAVIREGETYKKIVELAARSKAGVIFMAASGKTGARRLLMGSITEKVIGHSPCPVLVVKG